MENLERRRKEAWVVDYVDKTEGGKRRLKSFEKKKDAVNFAATARVEVRAGVHTADSESITISEAGRLWIATGEKNRLDGTLDGYRQHLELQIAPYLGGVRLRNLARQWCVNLRTGWRAAMRLGALSPGRDRRPWSEKSELVFHL